MEIQLSNQHFQLSQDLPLHHQNQQIKFIQIPTSTNKFIIKYLKNEESKLNQSDQQLQRDTFILNHQFQNLILSSKQQIPKIQQKQQIKSKISKYFHPFNSLKQIKIQNKNKNISNSFSSTTKKINKPPKIYYQNKPSQIAIQFNNKQNKLKKKQQQLIQKWLNINTINININNLFIAKQQLQYQLKQQLEIRHLVQIMFVKKLINDQKRQDYQQLEEQLNNIIYQISLILKRKTHKKSKKEKYDININYKVDNTNLNMQRKDILVQNNSNFIKQNKQINPIQINSCQESNANNNKANDITKSSTFHENYNNLAQVCHTTNLIFNGEEKTTNKYLKSSKQNRKHFSQHNFHQKQQKKSKQHLSEQLTVTSTSMHINVNQLKQNKIKTQKHFLSQPFFYKQKKQSQLTKFQLSLQKYHKQSSPSNLINPPHPKFTTPKNKYLPTKKNPYLKKHRTRYTQTATHQKSINSINNLQLTNNCKDHPTNTQLTLVSQQQPSKIYLSTNKSYHSSNKQQQNIITKNYHPNITQFTANKITLSKYHNNYNISQIILINQQNSNTIQNNTFDHSNSSQNLLVNQNHYLQPKKKEQFHKNLQTNIVNTIQQQNKQQQVITSIKQNTPQKTKQKKLIKRNQPENEKLSQLLLSKQQQYLRALKWKNMFTKTLKKIKMPNIPSQTNDKFLIKNHQLQKNPRKQLFQRILNLKNQFQKTLTSRIDIQGQSIFCPLIQNKKYQNSINTQQIPNQQYYLNTSFSTSLIKPQQTFYQDNFQIDFIKNFTKQLNTLNQKYLNIQSQYQQS